MFQGKTVIVTGGANGIGRTISKMYAEEKANVVIADIDEENGIALAEQLLADELSALFFKTDVRSEQNVKQLMERAYHYFGSIDVLINNAGKSVWTDPLALSLDDFDDLIATNLRSVFLCSREAVKWMKLQGGAIVNIASTRALMSEPHTEAYAASKGGILSLTHALASSFARYNITVNAISPGWIEIGDTHLLREEDHAQHFSGRVGIPEDVARACLYLTNPSNNFVNGTNIVVDGGMTRKMIYEQ